MSIKSYYFLLNNFFGIRQDFYAIWTWFYYEKMSNEGHNRISCQGTLLHRGGQYFIIKLCPGPNFIDHIHEIWSMGHNFMGDTI